MFGIGVAFSGMMFISRFVKINWFKRFQLLMRETTYRQHINLIPTLFSSNLFVVKFEKGPVFQSISFKGRMSSE